MKWYKYLVFCCLVFFCFCSNVFGIKVNGESYEKDCNGNVVVQRENVIGNSDIADISDDNCAISVTGKEEQSSSEKTLYSCTPEPTKEEKSRKILLLIDNSYSMYTADNDWKVKEVRNIFKQIATQMEDSDKIYIKYFKNVWKGKTNWDKEYSKTDVNTKDKRNNAANDILTYTKNGDKCVTSLCYGTPTYSVNALQKAKDFVNDADLKKSVPIVIFITDGYPTSFVGSETPKKVYDLGYLSSARHFYKFAVAMKELKETFDALKTKTNGNTYIANGQFSPKFVTIGLGVDNNNNNAAKYLLNTDSETLNQLSDNAASSNPKSTKQKYREDTKFYNMLQTKNDDDKYEITASIASNPDLGVAGTSPDDDAKKITFTAAALSIIKNTAEKKEVAFGPIRTTNIKNVTYYKKVDGKCTQTTVSPSDNHWLKNLSDGYDNFSVITIPSDDKCLLDNKVVINLKSKVSESLKTYSSGNNRIASELNGFVSDYYGKNQSNKVKLDEIQSILNYGAAPKKKVSKTITVKKTTYNSLNSGEQLLSLGNGYVRHCSSLVKENQNCSSTYVNLRVKYFIVYNVQFDGEPLKNNDSAIAPGTGFKFQNLKTTITGKWLYTGYADLNYQSPIIQYQVFDSDQWYDINLDSVYSDKNLTTNFISKDLLWNKIDTEVNKIVNIKNTYTTVNSNDANVINKDVSENIDSNSATSKIFPTKDDSNTYYVTTTTDSIKKACVNDKNFKYIEAEESCQSNWVAANSVSGENDAYIGDNDRIYFIPYGYTQQEVSVNVNLKLFNKKFSTICKINVHNSNSPCAEESNSSTSESNSVTPEYRSIDKDNPFPRAANNYYSIPVNWRSWYCSGASQDGKCIVNSPNETRLKNSYNNIYYSGSYNTEKLTTIAKDTLNNVNHYYSSWNNIASETGKSKSIGSESTDIIDEKFGGVKSYCPLGSFDSYCDEVMK